MTERPYLLICRRCEDIPELVGEEGHHDVYCTRCGIRGDAEEVRQVAFKHLVQREVNRQGREVMRNVASDLKRVNNLSDSPGKFSAKRLAAPDFIFIEDHT